MESKNAKTANTENFDSATAQALATSQALGSHLRGIPQSVHRMVREHPRSGHAQFGRGLHLVSPSRRYRHVQRTPIWRRHRMYLHVIPPDSQTRVSQNTGFGQNIVSPNQSMHPIQTILRIVQDRSGSPNDPRDVSNWPQYETDPQAAPFTNVPLQPARTACQPSQQPDP